MANLEEFVVYDGKHNVEIERERYEQETGKEFKPFGNTESRQKLYRFENDYGASIISGGIIEPFANYEIALIRYDENDSYKLVGDVTRFNDIEDVNEVLEGIKNDPEQAQQRHFI